MKTFEWHKGGWVAAKHTTLLRYILKYLFWEHLFLSKIYGAYYNGMVKNC